MSIEASAWVWECSQAKGAGRFILLAIADKAPASTCQAYASLSWLQDMANVGRPAVVKGLKDVLASGELEVVEGETGPFGASVYRLPKAVGYVPGSARSVRKQNRSNAAVTPADGVQDGAIGSETEPIDEHGEDPSGASADGIGSETEPGGSETEPIQGGSETEPIEAIGSQTEPIEEGLDGQSVLFSTSIGSETEPLHKNTTTNRSTKETRASAKASAPGRPGGKGDDRTPVNPDAFAAFWKAYPKKDSKPAAIKAWNAAFERDAETKPEVVIAGAQAYRDWTRRDPKYTKNPATWLNNDCWDNEYEPDRPNSNGGHQPYLEADGGYEFGTDFFDEDPR